MAFFPFLNSATVLLFPLWVLIFASLEIPIQLLHLDLRSYSTSSAHLHVHVHALIVLPNSPASLLRTTVGIWELNLALSSIWTCISLFLAEGGIGIGALFLGRSEALLSLATGSTSHVRCVL